MENINIDNVRISINEDLRNILLVLNEVENILLFNSPNEYELKKEIIINSMNYYMYNELDGPPIKRRRLNNE